MKSTRFSLLAALLTTSLLPSLAQADAKNIRFARSPDISPDGKWVAFSYQGDIWVVDAKGGVARPVTRHEAYHVSPIFSPDGNRLAFTANRHGSYDVFVVPVRGGRPNRLTFDSGSDVANNWSPDGKHILFSSTRSAAYPHGYELYTVPAEGGREYRVSLAEGREGVYSPTGDRIAYVRGPGTWYRKGYRGSSNDDIWICNADGSHNRRFTSFIGQDNSPMWSADGQYIYYVSECFGTANIVRQAVVQDAEQQGKAISLKAEILAAQADLDSLEKQFAVAQTEADRSRIGDEKAQKENLLRRKEGELKNASDGMKPQPITSHKDDSVRRARLSGNGEWIVYECGPDIWIVASKGGTPRKLAIEAYADDKTNPDRLETYSRGATEYALSPDEKHIAFVVHGELFLIPVSGGKATRLTHSSAYDHGITWAPDGKSILFASDRGGQENLYLLQPNDPEHPQLVKAHKFKEQQLTFTPEAEVAASFSPDGKRIAFVRGGKLWTMNPEGKDAKVVVDQTQVIDYDWSPDSKWFVYARSDGSFASDLYIIPATGGTARNITRFATYNADVSWSTTGNKLAFVSQRRRNATAMCVLSLQRPAVKDAKPTTDIDWEDIHLRVEKLSGTAEAGTISPDGTKIAFRSSTPSEDLWVAKVNGGQLTRLSTGNLRPQQIRWNKKSDTIYFRDLTGGIRTAKVAVPGEPARIAFSAKMVINRDEEYAEVFEQSWRALSEYFYDSKFHGANWNAVRAKYRPLVKDVATKEDLHALISLMLGELNASHLGISGSKQYPEETTAELGLVFDETYRGPGLKVADILKRGPADKRGLKLGAGDIILSLDGTELTDSVNISKLLNGKVGVP